MHPKDIGTSLLASPLAASTDQIFVKDGVPQFGRAYFHRGGCHKQLQSYLSHLRKALDFVLASSVAKTESSELAGVNRGIRKDTEWKLM